MHTFLNNFHNGGKYSQAELRREVNITDHKYLSILSLHTNYLNIDSKSGCGINSEKKILSRQSAIFVEVTIIQQKNVSKGSRMESKKLVQMIILITDVRNASHKNV